MDVTLDRNIIEKLSHRGILAYLAVVMADGTMATTASLAGMVKSRTESLREGLEELSRVTETALVRRCKNRWICGRELLGDSVQILDSSKFQRFVDDLKKYHDFLNPDIPFSMGARDGQVIQRFLKDHPGWDQEQWRLALNHRGKSVVKLNAAPRTEPFYMWIGKLASYAGGPLDRYGHPPGGGERHEKQRNTEEANRAAAERYLASLEDRRGGTP